MYSHDDHPETLHLGAFDGDRLVAIASLYREARPNRPSRAAWRMRGMATDPEVRDGLRQGRAGRAVAHVTAEGGASCGATPGAGLAFYLGNGFEVEGDEFEIDGIGPHIVGDPWRSSRRSGHSGQLAAEGAGAAALLGGAGAGREGGGAAVGRRFGSPSVPSTHGR